MSMITPKLHIEDVYKRYGHKLVLDNIDLSVATGELCTLVGPSGCGKSTLLRLVLGQEFPDQGKVMIDGNFASYPDPHRGIVYQKYSLYPHLTVLDNVLLGLRLKRQQWWLPWRFDQDAQEQSMAMLEQLRLADARNKYPHELSGGMQQRVAIAQALVTRPPILLMDEPFGALDPDTREQMQVYLMELHEQYKLTIFFVTHDLEEACFIGTRLLVLSQYYTDDRGDDPQVNRGAKIVSDYDLEKHALPTTEKGSPVYREFVAHVRESGFNPVVRRHVNEFNLHHPHSFRTLTADESKVAASKK
jgi:NitT/TauT family transport system ATP-binding protein